MFSGSLWPWSACRKEREWQYVRINMWSVSSDQENGWSELQCPLVITDVVHRPALWALVHGHGQTYSSAEAHKKHFRRAAPDYCEQGRTGQGWRGAWILAIKEPAILALPLSRCAALGNLFNFLRLILLLCKMGIILPPIFQGFLRGWSGPM